MDVFTNLSNRFQNFARGITKLVLGELSEDDNQAAIFGSTVLSLVVGGCLVVFIAVTVSQDFSNIQTDNQPKASFVNQFGETHTLNLELATTLEQHQQGLMFRTYLPADQAMLFVFSDAQPREFWMKNTYLSLDIIYLDPQGRVVSLYESTLSNQTEITYPSQLPAQYVIETNAGWAQTSQLGLGDQFQLSL